MMGAFTVELVRRGARMLPDGPFETLGEAKRRGAFRLELEPREVRQDCASVVYEAGKAIEEYVFVDHAPAEARNRKWGYAWRSL